MYVLELANNVRDQGHEAGALHRLAERALAGGRKAGAAARHDLAVRIEKLFDRLDVLVVDRAELRTSPNGHAYIARRVPPDHLKLVERDIPPRDRFEEDSVT